MTDTHGTIRSQFSTLRRESRARHRDIAESLGIGEGALIAAHVGFALDDAAVTLQAVRLRPEWPQVVAAVESLGDVMALTRNASCVHEKRGVYHNVSGGPAMGLVLGGAIDLRVFYTRWAHGFAVREHTADGLQRSLQFFDGAGVAVHKVFMKEASDIAAYDLLTARFAAADQQCGIVTVAAAQAPAALPDAAIDVAGLRTAWAGLRDTHEFFGLLKRFSVARTQALRLADPQYVQAVDLGSCRDLLEAAAREAVPIMVFTGNAGMIQIHSGPVKKIAVMGPWVNVLDPAFNLHLREDHIASAFVVRKPTVDGLVTSLELYDAAGETIAMFFGERKPGKPELCEWRALVANLLPVDADVLEAEPCAA